MQELAELIFDPGQEDLLKLIKQKIDRRNYLLKLIDAEFDSSNNKVRSKTAGALQIEIDILIKAVQSSEQKKTSLALRLMKAQRRVASEVQKSHLLYLAACHLDEVKNAWSEQSFDATTRILDNRLRQANDSTKHR